MVDMEQWCSIPTFSNYSVSNFGRVRNEETGRNMALLRNQHGLVNVGLTRNRVQYKRCVARLVAQAFLPAPPEDSFDTPINLDGDRTNNRAENLLWRPRWFAVKYFDQFDEPIRMGSFDTPIEEINSGEIFANSWDAAIRYGLLESEIFLAMLNRTYVWPTYQQFRVIPDQTENRYQVA